MLPLEQGEEGAEVLVAQPLPGDGVQRVAAEQAGHARESRGHRAASAGAQAREVDQLGPPVALRAG